jgi:hypothetical protein
MPQDHAMTRKKKPPPVDPSLPFPEPQKETGSFFLNDGPPRKPATAFNIAADIDEGRRKAAEEVVRLKASKGGKVSAEVQAPKVEARHTLVLDLMREIEAANPALAKEDIATKIESRLPVDSRLGRGQILRIMRGPKKRPAS